MTAGAAPDGWAPCRTDAHLEAASSHAPALGAHRRVGQPMRGLADVAPPDVRVACQIQVHAFMRRALNTDQLDAGNVQAVLHPSSQVLVGGLPHSFVAQAVVKLRDSSPQDGSQPVDVTPGIAPSQPAARSARWPSDASHARFPTGSAVGRKRPLTTRARLARGSASGDSAFSRCGGDARGPARPAPMLPTPARSVRAQRTAGHRSRTPPSRWPT